MSNKNSPVRKYRGVRYMARASVIPTGWAQCGTCGRVCDDTTSTGLTPAPAGRCPFEHWHKKVK